MDTGQRSFSPPTISRLAEAADCMSQRIVIDHLPVKKGEGRLLIKYAVPGTPLIHLRKNGAACCPPRGPRGWAPPTVEAAVPVSGRAEEVSEVADQWRVPCPPRGVGVFASFCRHTKGRRRAGARPRGLDWPGQNQLVPPLPVRVSLCQQYKPRGPAPAWRPGGLPPSPRNPRRPEALRPPCGGFPAPNR